MAKVIWSPSSLDDIDTIAKYISKIPFIMHPFSSTGYLKPRTAFGYIRCPAGLSRKSAITAAGKLFTALIE